MRVGRSPAPTNRARVCWNRPHGGTIFLDEVADIPLPLQVKLLRVLEHGEILPVGADRPVQSDFRLISATHQDLRQRVAEGRFRHDLYFRLITFEIDIPPLRQRCEDIAELAGYFLDGLAAKNGQPRPAISAAALAELQRRPWLGNVRELRNAIEHAMILARGGIIAPEHLPPPLGEMGVGSHFPGGGNPLAGASMGGAAAWRSRRRRRPLRSAVDMRGATAVAGRDGALRGPMPGRRSPPRLAPHDSPQETRRAGNRRFLNDRHKPD